MLEPLPLKDHVYLGVERIRRNVYQTAMLNLRLGVAYGNDRESTESWLHKLDRLENQGLFEIKQIEPGCRHIVPVPIAVRTTAGSRAMDIVLRYWFTFGDDQILVSLGDTAAFINNPPSQPHIYKEGSVYFTTRGHFLPSPTKEFQMPSRDVIEYQCQHEYNEKGAHLLVMLSPDKDRIESWVNQPFPKEKNK